MDGRGRGWVDERGCCYYIMSVADEVTAIFQSTGRFQSMSMAGDCGAILGARGSRWHHMHCLRCGWILELGFHACPRQWGEGSGV